MRSSQRVLFACFLVVSLVLTACGPAGPVAEPTAAPAQPTQAPASDPMAMYEPAAVTGDIIAAGSSTVFPLSEAVAELFRDEGYGGNLTIDSIGSGAGLERRSLFGRRIAVRGPGRPGSRPRTTAASPHACGPGA